MPSRLRPCTGQSNLTRTERQCRSTSNLTDLIPKIRFPHGRIVDLKLTSDLIPLNKRPKFVLPRISLSTSSLCTKNSQHSQRAIQNYTPQELKVRSCNRLGYTEICLDSPEVQLKLLKQREVDAVNRFTRGKALKIEHLGLMMQKEKNKTNATQTFFPFDTKRKQSERLIKTAHPDPGRKNDFGAWAWFNLPADDTNKRKKQFYPKPGIAPTGKLTPMKSDKFVSGSCSVEEFLSPFETESSSSFSPSEGKDWTWDKLRKARKKTQNSCRLEKIRKIRNDFQDAQQTKQICNFENEKNMRGRLQTRILHAESILPRFLKEESDNRLVGW
eukprot:snap_masked-scaffold_2-processed-gene-13.18-mRNA-1 protein AED:1.00 eAED:1.00 QI:0/-1/0/0/-1/1/1/0/328